MTISARRILIVDDEPSVRNLLVRLVRQVHYTAEEASTVPEALRIAHNGECDLALVDFFLPPCTAVDFLCGLAGPRRPKTVVISGKATAEHAAAAIRAGAQEFLEKPIRLERLWAAIGIDNQSLVTTRDQLARSDCKQFNGKGAEHVRAGLRIIETRFCDQTLNLNSTADELHLCPDYLSRLFKLGTGQGFGKHLHDRRIAEAQVLLARTELPIKDVAWSCGYHTNHELVWHFRRLCGCLPSEYRRAHLRELAPQ